jgi:hypothetical protein
MSMNEWMNKDSQLVAICSLPSHLLYFYKLWLELLLPLYSHSQAERLQILSVIANYNNMQSLWQILFKSCNVPSSVQESSM